MDYTRQRKRVLRAFGDRLRQERLSKGVSQEKLAGLAGLDRTYVGGAERGERNVSLVNLVRLAQALGVQVDRLLRGVGH